jgi:Fe-S-cluster containining protein
MSDLDAEVQGIGVVCWLRGQCCDFEAAGHRLYASRIEAERFAAGVDLTDWDPATGLCPAWKDRRCTAREGRPSACRTYFCDPVYEDATGELSERYITRLKWLHDKHGRPWEYRDWIAHLADLKAERSAQCAGTAGKNTGDKPGLPTGNDR